MTQLQSKLGTNNDLLKFGIIVLISITGLLSAKAVSASPSSNYGYTTQDQTKNASHRVSTTNRYGHSQPREKHSYSTEYTVNNSDSLKHYKNQARSHQRYQRRSRNITHRRYNPRSHYSRYPVIATQPRYYSSSASHIQYKSHNNSGAMLVGGVLGGVIANDISGGDGAITAVGAFTGAILAGGLTH